MFILFKSVGTVYGEDEKILGVSNSLLTLIELAEQDADVPLDWWQTHDGITAGYRIDNAASGLPAWVTYSIEAHEVLP